MSNLATTLHQLATKMYKVPGAGRYSHNIIYLIRFRASVPRSDALPSQHIFSNSHTTNVEQARGRRFTTFAAFMRLATYIMYVVRVVSYLVKLLAAWFKDVHNGHNSIRALVAPARVVGPINPNWRRPRWHQSALSPISKWQALKKEEPQSHTFNGQHTHRVSWVSG